MILVSFISLFVALIAQGTLIFFFLIVCGKSEKRARQAHQPSPRSGVSNTRNRSSSKNRSSSQPRDSPKSFTANSASFNASKQSNAQQNNKSINDVVSATGAIPCGERDHARDKKLARFAFLHHFIKRAGDKQRKKERLRQNKQNDDNKPRKSEKELDPTQTAFDVTQVATTSKAQGDGKTDKTMASAWSTKTCTAQTKRESSKANTALCLNE